MATKKMMKQKDMMNKKQAETMMNGKAKKKTTKAKKAKKGVK